MAGEEPEVGDKGTLHDVPSQSRSLFLVKAIPTRMSLHFNICIITCLSPLPIEPIYTFSSHQSNVFALIVSWNWNGSAPSGEVIEKKDEGEVAIQSKRGNTIKKAAQPNDPAVHLARPGNDVVKNQSELNIEEKKAGDGEETEHGEDGEEEEAADGDANEEEDGEKEEATKGKTEGTKSGKKRKAEAEVEGQGESSKKARGRPKGSTNTPKNAEPKEPKEPAKKRGRRAATAKPAAAKPATANGEKKTPAARGKPKKEGTGPKPKAPATGIGKRTRSGGK